MSKHANNQKALMSTKKTRSPKKLPKHAQKETLELIYQEYFVNKKRYDDIAEEHRIGKHTIQKAVKIINKHLQPELESMLDNMGVHLMTNYRQNRELVLEFMDEDREGMPIKDKVAAARLLKDLDKDFVDLMIRQGFIREAPKQINLQQETVQFTISMTQDEYPTFEHPAIVHTDQQQTR